MNCRITIEMTVDEPVQSVQEPVQSVQEPVQSEHSSEWQAIIDYFDRDNKPKHEILILIAKTRSKPFCELTANKCEAVKATLDEMVNAGILIMKVINSERYYSLTKNINI